MAKFTAPASLDHFSFDEVVYRRDEHGDFNIDHPDHVQKAVLHGAVPKDAAVPGMATDAPAPVPDEHGNLAIINDLNAKLLAAHANTDKAEGDVHSLQEQLDATAAENERLKSGYAALEARLAALEATDTAGTGGDASGDTSEDTGGDAPSTAGTDEPVDGTRQAIGHHLAAFPDFTGENLDRDGKVAWLASVGITISTASSKAVAQQAIDEVIADYRADVSTGESA